MIERWTERKMLRSDDQVAGATAVSFCVVNPYLLERTLRLSDRFEIKASIEIVDERGVELWSAGAPVSRALHERMQGRRLRRPLEESLEIGGGVSMNGAITDCLALIEKNRALETLASQKGVRDLLRSLRSMILPEPLRLLLTSARELAPHDYEVSLAAMIVSAGLTCQAGFGERDAGQLILAALVADIGEMYIDPESLEPARRLGPRDWGGVVWHPCVGEEFLKKFTRFPAAVSDGVLHHHERFGGYGYPFQVAGERLGMLHTMLGAADSVAAIVMRGGASIAERVSVALHILPGEFPAPVVSLVTKMLDGLDESLADSPGSGIADCIRPELERLRAAGREATKLFHGGHGLSVIVAADLALSVLLRLDQSLGASRVYGFMAQAVPENDAAIMSTLRMVPAEICWRLRNLARNVHLQAAQNGTVQDLAALGGLLAVLDPLSAAGSGEPVS